MTLKNLLKARLVKALSGISASKDESSVELSSINLANFGKGMGIAILSGILGMCGAVFSSYPLGIAFLCASGKYTLYSYIGLLVSSLTNKGMAVALAFIYTMALFLRFAAGRFLLNPSTKDKPPAKERLLKIFSAKAYRADAKKAFSEGILLRVAIACFSAFIFGLYRLIGGGFLYYDLFGLLAGFFLTPIITLALSGLFTREIKYQYSREIAVFTLTFITVYALNDYIIFGFSPALSAAFFITLWAGSTVGGLKGCAIGLLSGLACTNTALMSSSASALLGITPCLMAFTGLVHGSLRRFFGNVTILFSCAVTSALGWALGGFGILSRLIPDMLTAAAIFFPLAKSGILPKITVLVNPRAERPSDNSLLSAKMEADSRQKISALSEAFSHLSDTIYALSDRMRRPGVVDLKQVCDSTFAKFCDKCKMASICLEKECVSTLDAHSKITASLYKKGRATLDDVPSYMRNRCYNIGTIVEEMNHETAKLIEKLIKNDRTEAFAIDYEVISKLLAARIADRDEEYKVDRELTNKLCKSLGYMNIAAERAICFGKRRKQVVVGDFDIANVQLGAKEIRTAVENTIGVPMSAPSFNIDGDMTTMCLTSRRKFKLEFATATGMKESENANGDNTAFFTNSEDYSYAIISDGMGSGKDAAITSKICAFFAERMLGAGNSVAITLEMLNGFIRSRGVECSATVDLAEIDLITGNACFIKSGAAPSFVLRSGNIYKLQSKTMPIGIMPELDAEQIKFELEADDVIVMLSDGVTSSLEDGIWLANLLTYEWEEDLKRMADKILDAASVSNKRGDDMTVLLIRVGENNA